MDARRHWVLAAIAALGLGLPMAACEQEGPAEGVGETIDETADEAREGIDDATDELDD